MGLRGLAGPGVAAVRRAAFVLPAREREILRGGVGHRRLGKRPSPGVPRGRRRHRRPPGPGWARRRPSRHGRNRFLGRPEARRRGVATTTVRAVCAWAFETLDLEIIEWRCEVGNHASRRVVEKAGFLEEGTLRKRLFHHGERVDAWVGSLLKDEALRRVSA
ncbi:GNAT family N-acetyltransferase [Nonomuraea angiospora]|uniref:GNAT family N-acetyltransferase n=1 Tax=Nonomuraea angiospora TaxID=46172 RepID=UPI001789B9C5